MAETLGAPDWLIAPGARAVINALETVRPGATRFVGGCVRNAVMGVPVDDIDLATQLKPQEVVAAAKGAGLRAIPTGVEHGTVTLISEGTPYEVTTLRRDVETDGRRAVVAFTEDWAEDARRRDFRLNALYAAPDGEIYDPVGGGLADARAGRVVFIGDADARLREDYLRILRFFRFNAWYGAAMDAPGLEACERQKRGLAKIAAERIWKELRKTLAAPNPSDALAAMERAGVLAEVLPDAKAAATLGSLVRVEVAAKQGPDPMRRFLALLPRRPDNVADAARRLRLSNRERDRALAWAKDDTDMSARPDAAWARARVYRLGSETFLDRLLLDRARSASKGDEGIAVALDTALHWTKPRFPLSGEDVAAAGVPPGPATGRILRAVEDWWIDADFPADRTRLDNALADAVRRDGS